MVAIDTTAHISASALLLQVVAGFLASTSDERVLTGNNWKCVSQIAATDNWTSVDFNDKNWSPAVVAAPHSASDIHNVLQGISLKASWIWTLNHGYNGAKIDATVYCRLTLSGQYTDARALLPDRLFSLATTSALP